MASRYKGIKVNGVKKDEHRYIMEQHLGRSLSSDEVVHHINGDPQDNRLENLSVMSSRDHARLHYDNDTQLWTEDSIKKRLASLTGRSNDHQRKLTEDEVRYIRANYKPYDKENGARALGEKYSISHSEISRIANRKTYKNIV